MSRIAAHVHHLLTQVLHAQLLLKSRVLASRVGVTMMGGTKAASIGHLRMAIPMNAVCKDPGWGVDSRTVLLASLSGIAGLRRPEQW